MSSTKIHWYSLQNLIPLTYLDLTYLVQFVKGIASEPP